MSTYEFIVSSRDSRPNLSDVEAGSKSPATRKLFKVQCIAPEIVKVYVPFRGMYRFATQTIWQAGTNFTHLHN